MGSALAARYSSTLICRTACRRLALESLDGLAWPGLAWLGAVGVGTRTGALEGGAAHGEQAAHTHLQARSRDT